MLPILEQALGRSALGLLAARRQGGTNQGGLCARLEALLITWPAACNAPNRSVDPDQASTSGRGDEVHGSHSIAQLRCYASAATGGKGGKPTAPAPPSATPSTPAQTPKDNPLKLRSPVRYWKLKHLPEQGKLTLRPLRGDEDDTDGGAQAQLPRALDGWQLGPRGVVQLMHESMSDAVGEHVHLRPFVFSNLFQSAPAVAQYVAAALEAGTSWQRVERFFLASVEEDRAVAAIKVQVKGRMGRNASMASSKVWETGTIRLRSLGDPVDYGAAQALTRVGVLGVKVWLRFKRGAAAGSMMRATPRASAASFTDLLTSPRVALPHFQTAWWTKPGPEQPAENQTSLALDPAYKPGTSIHAFLTAQLPRTFRNNEERLVFLRKARRAQRRRAKLLVGGVPVQPAAIAGVA